MNSDSESDSFNNPLDTSDSCNEEARDVELSRTRCNFPEQKKRKIKHQQARRKRTAQGRVRNFFYSGTQRRKRKKLSGEKKLLAGSPKQDNCASVQMEVNLKGDDFIDELLDTIRFEEMSGYPARKTWQEREASHQLAWEKVRRTVFEKVAASQPFTRRACDNCFSSELTSTRAVRCGTCKKHFCPMCDMKMHETDPFHKRMMVTRASKETLMASEFFDDSWNPFNKDVSVPCFLPSTCEHCACTGTLSLMTTLNKIVVVTTDGRYDLHGAKFFCKSCKHEKALDKFDYINSGYWPGDCNNMSYLFAEELLLLWYHLQHKSPGVSAIKFLNTLEEVSAESDRCAIINKALFARAAQEWEFFRHTVDVEIFEQEKMYCPCCGNNPVSGSSDANMKCRHLKSAGAVRKAANQRDELEQESNFYGSQAIVSDDVVKAHRDKIYTKIKRSKQKEMCGGSVFKAAAIDAPKRDKYDITGLIVSTCRHGMINKAINMEYGETFTHTHFMHYLCHRSNCRYFCYDVVCRYWKFAKNVSYFFPEFRDMTNTMKGFLPIMHAKAHHLPCQIRWNPHWQKGVGMTIGEEHEQVFSKLSRYGYITKHMRKQGRHRHLSAAIFYWNKAKFNNFPRTLSKRLIKAQTTVELTKNKLGELLKNNSLDPEDLPNVKKELRFNAIYSMQNKKNRSVSLDKLERKLEGLYVQIKTIASFISNHAEHSKARNRMRQSLSRTKANAKKTISLINRKCGKNYVTEENFDKGIFPWDMNAASSSSDKKISSHAKYDLVDWWMRRDRAIEEISLCKKEVSNYLRFLGKKRATLEANAEHFDSSEGLGLGSAFLIRTEIAKLNEKIQATLNQFELISIEDFRLFFSTDNLEDPSDNGDSDLDNDSDQSLVSQTGEDDNLSDSFSDVSEPSAEESSETCSFSSE